MTHLVVSEVWLDMIEISVRCVLGFMWKEMFEDMLAPWRVKATPPSEGESMEERVQCCQADLGCGPHSAPTQRPSRSREPRPPSRTHAKAGGASDASGARHSVISGCFRASAVSQVVTCSKTSLPGNRIPLILLKNFRN